MKDYYPQMKRASDEYKERLIREIDAKEPQHEGEPDIPRSGGWVTAARARELARMIWAANPSPD